MAGDGSPASMGERKRRVVGLERWKLIY
jgi:hypothetical protein